VGLRSAGSIIDASDTIQNETSTSGQPLSHGINAKGAAGAVVILSGFSSSRFSNE